MRCQPGSSEHTLVLKTGEKKEFLEKIYFRRKSDFVKCCKILAKNEMITRESMRALGMNPAKPNFSLLFFPPSFFINRFLSSGKGQRSEHKGRQKKKKKKRKERALLFC